MSVNPSNLREKLAEFTAYRELYLDGDEKSEAQIFLERLFQAFGHAGIAESGARLEERLRATGQAVSFADLRWSDRCLFEMKKAGADLTRHYRQAFDYWVRAVPNRPRYVVLCNFDEFWIYDFDTQLDTPLDKVKVTDLSDRLESLTFMLPVERAPIFGTDLETVTRAAAAQVSKVFRSLVERNIPRPTAQHFALQSVVAMFSEDIGLLPGKYFTRALEDSASGSDAYDLLGNLFREMNTPGLTPGGRYANTPYFNGGLFANVEPIELTEAEIQMLREACKTNWSDVRPEIFGTIFEASMDKGERHAWGAHFTSPADIAKVVFPTIVKPWTDRIEAARSIRDLEQILLDMSTFRVLDPACGSGNFLYVAYREMRRLEHEVQAQIDDRRRSEGTRSQIAISYVTPDHFLGFDNNHFAVEVAKVTMMLAKKLAADELQDHQQDVLPLDNLDDSIQARDALFSPWPRANVIIGNPPYLGRRKMQEELGAAYTSSLAAAHPTVGAVSDFVTYWFQIAHRSLRDGERAGFVATQAIRDGSSRGASLDYIVDNDGAIVDAVSAQPWSGDAAVTVSIVNWVKGVHHAPEHRVLWLDNGNLRLEVPNVASSLRPTTDVRLAERIPANVKPKRVFQGQTTGDIQRFTLSRGEAKFEADRVPSSAPFLHPTIGGDELLGSKPIDTFVIDVETTDAVIAEAQAPNLLRRLDDVLAKKQAAAEKERIANEQILAANARAKVNWHHRGFLRTWWTHAYRRQDMLTAFENIDRYIALSRVAAEGRATVFCFVDTSIRPDDSLAVIALDDDYSFGVLSSSLHRAWFDERCSKLETRPRYTPTTVWDSFPWPANPSTAEVAKIAGVSKKIIDQRASYLAQGATLKGMYDALRQPGASPLRSLHEELDAAVMDCYGFSDADDKLAQMLALNLAVASDPSQSAAPGSNGYAEAYTTSWKLSASPLG